MPAYKKFSDFTDILTPFIVSSLSKVLKYNFISGPGRHHVDEALELPRRSSSAVTRRSSSSVSNRLYAASTKVIIINTISKMIGLSYIFR